MKRGVKEIKKRHERYKMNNQGRVDLDNNVGIHSIGMVVLLSVTLIAICVIINNNLFILCSNLQMGIQQMKRTKIVTNSICTQPTVMEPINYQVTYSANKSIYWCGDCN
jgi:hypothetical protein